jgi:hypothetical protein
MVKLSAKWLQNTSEKMPRVRLFRLCEWNTAFPAVGDEPSYYNDVVRKDLGGRDRLGPNRRWIPLRYDGLLKKVEAM